MRTIVDLPTEQIQALAELCQREGISRAEAIRRAVERFTAEALAPALDEAFGLWRERTVDGLDYERQLREEW